MLSFPRERGREGGKRGRQEDRRSTEKLHEGKREHREDRRWKVIETYIQRQKKRAEVSLPLDPAAFGVCL